MDKYTGCNIVESVQTAAAPEVGKRKKRYVGIVVRLAIAAAVVGFFCVLKFAPWSALDPVREFARSVFCYDVFGRTDLGSTPAITRIVEWFA